jgi:cytochrome c5
MPELHRKEKAAHFQILIAAIDVISEEEIARLEGEEISHFDLPTCSPWLEVFCSICLKSCARNIPKTIDHLNWNSRLGQDAAPVGSPDQQCKLR